MQARRLRYKKEHPGPALGGFRGPGRLPFTRAPHNGSLFAGPGRALADEGTEKGRRLMRIAQVFVSSCALVTLFLAGWPAPAMDVA